MNELITVNKRWRWVITYAGIFYEDYLRSLYGKVGHKLSAYEECMLIELNEILQDRDIIKLSEKQYAFVFLLLDFVCKRALEDGHPPYNENEIKMFKDSQLFMDKFKNFKSITTNWLTAKHEKELVRIN